MDKVIKMEPDSSAAYQFRSLINFADGDFEAGAADAYDTLMKGPVWSWETIASLYDDSKTYEAQYLELAKAAAKDDNSMSKHFLLAFHHLALGHEDQGKAELVKVLEIQPNEPLTQKMLEKLGGKESNKQLASK